MEKKQLPNLVARPPFTSAVAYDVDENFFNFDISIQNAKTREYALVFRNADDSEYTAAIVSSRSPMAKCSVRCERLKESRRLSLLDIDTEELVFLADFAGIIEYPPEKGEEHEDYDEADFDQEDSSPEPGFASPESGQQEDDEGFREAAGEEDVPEEESPPLDFDTSDGEGSDGDEEDDGEDSLADFLSGFEGAGFGVPGFSEEVSPGDGIFAVPDSSGADEATGQDLDFFFEGFEEIGEDDGDDDTDEDDGDTFAQENRITFIDETGDEDHIIGFTPSPPAGKKKKRHGYSLINDNPDLLDEYFHSFSSFESPQKNREFFVLDEASAEEHSLRVTLNGYNVPLTTPFLEYKSSSLKDTNYPERLVGRLCADNAAEYFIFASLGRNTPDEQPFMGATGFAYFEPIKGEDFGYWLSYLSATTGKISLPMKPKGYEQ